MKVRHMSLSKSSAQTLQKFCPLFDTYFRRKRISCSYWSVLRSEISSEVCRSPQCAVHDHFYTSEKVRERLIKREEGKERGKKTE